MAINVMYTGVTCFDLATYRYDVHINQRLSLQAATKQWRQKGIMYMNTQKEMNERYLTLSSLNLPLSSSSTTSRELLSQFST